MTRSPATTMRAVEIRAVDGHHELSTTRRPVPTPGKSEVLIRVRAAGVNGHDVHQIHNGGHPILPGETDLPGLEVSGEIVGIGADVTRWAPGDAVCALLRGGGYAEYATTPAGNCLPKPANLDWAQAAVLPETFFTVWSNVFVDGALAEGESFLMNGGTSGIGVAAIQIASTLGRRVFATARGAEKVAVCERLGASRGIDYESENFADVIAAETGDRGVDVILDIVGGDYLDKDLLALAHGGRLIFIGAARGFVTPIDLRKVMRKQLRVGGSLLRPRSNAFKAAVAAALEERVWPHVLSGRIESMLDRSFALEDAAEAIRCLEERQHIGKIALIVAEG
ncbi:NAD(P)H-quinone oxidoreductase [uncultured Sphingomonas sp.]|jgi:NADPH:quinone reductase|uniref:NAD(P)H-quinone oxidoreductase n=1 Tax=uncultured Sphingomonas sp. TaxID=158754 RepID=UPI0030DAA1E4